MASKGSLAVFLGKLEEFNIAKVREEQYTTPSELAADILWQAYMAGDIEGKTIADLGAGTGILGLGTIYLGAKKVYFVESEANALEVCKRNLEKNVPPELYEIANIDISGFSQKVDTVIMNPPFGTKIKHADQEFLNKALEIAKVIYTIHKTSTNPWLTEYTRNYKTAHWEVRFPIKHTHSFHDKPVKYIDVSVWRIERNDTNI